jgi:hypothetical protein
MRSRQEIEFGTTKALLGTIVALALLALPAGAAAATNRYASPAGAGSTCSAALPCTLTGALAIAESGDTVVMAGNEGPYGTLLVPLVAELHLSSGVNLEGAVGQPAPQIFSNAPTVALRMEGGAGQRLANVAIQYEGPEAALRGAGTVERVLALSETSGCILSPETTLVDSVCAGKIGLEDNVGEAWSLTLRNDTIYGTETGLFAVSATELLQIAATNTVIRGGLRDIYANGSAPGTVAIALDHSNYVSVTSEGGASVTAAGSGTNQTAAPLFVNAAASDFHQATGSPTIDAGANDAANGPLDLAGNARTLAAVIPCPAVTDIGAYEYAGGPATCPSPPTERKQNLIVDPVGEIPKPPASVSIVKAKVEEDTATFRFKGSGGTGPLKFECKLDAKPFHSCKSPKAYKGLEPGKHKFSVRAVEAGGKKSKPAARAFSIKP